MARDFYVYIITNEAHSTFYVGMTVDLLRRVHQHRTHHFLGSFSDRYNIYKLLYFEAHTDFYSALSRERQLKHWHREWKMELVKKVNPALKDLVEELS
jgi:putative endonuclease